mmetsp:Transcript_5694/g.6677  ORF Transcript_5694/g.6677 Transcript_5694/m.6677 type:complete len:203 (-) Transcript_5694:88-696(-)
MPKVNCQGHWRRRGFAWHIEVHHGTAEFIQVSIHQPALAFQSRSDGQLRVLDRDHFFVTVMHVCKGSRVKLWTRSGFCSLRSSQFHPGIQNTGGRCQFATWVAEFKSGLLQRALFEAGACTPHGHQELHGWWVGLPRNIEINLCGAALLIQCSGHCPFLIIPVRLDMDELDSSCINGHLFLVTVVHVCENSIDRLVFTLTSA